MINFSTLSGWGELQAVNVLRVNTAKKNGRLFIELLREITGLSIIP
jgi:hypothetical protein